MHTFHIETFVTDLKSATEGAADRREAIANWLRQALATYGAETIRDGLAAAVPADADIGELIVHQDDELTVLFARVPAHFQSAIHDHTVCAVIGQLTGEEKSVIYKKSESGGCLQVVQELQVTPGEVMTLGKDAIHHIENPCDQTSCAIHIYGGNFKKVEAERSLWSFGEHEQRAFSFPALMQESVAAMKQSGNRAGLDVVGQAFPQARAMLGE